jgi:hypothetical protein
MLRLETPSRAIRLNMRDGDVAEVWIGTLRNPVIKEA